MQQLSIFAAAPPSYDREPVGADAPLTDAEVATLAAHGYHHLDGGTFDTPDGRQWGTPDWWRSEIDVLYLLSRPLITEETP
jgi:hypothetical protein